jgi:hypothetical protein
MVWGLVERVSDAPFGKNLELGLRAFVLEVAGFCCVEGGLGRVEEDVAAAGADCERWFASALFDKGQHGFAAGGAGAPRACAAHVQRDAIVDGVCEALGGQAMAGEFCGDAREVGRLFLIVPIGFGQVVLIEGEGAGEGNIAIGGIDDPFQRARKGMRGAGEGLGCGGLGGGDYKSGANSCSTAE